MSQSTEQKEQRKRYYDSHKEQSKKYYNSRKKHFKEWHLKRAYNITAQENTKMLIQQNNSCKICGNEFTGIPPFRPHVDHDHQTNKIRGLLCNNCNVGIGMLNDDPTTIRNAIKWIQKGKS